MGNAFTNTDTSGDLTVKLWRGERMCLIAMDIREAKPDFVGFAIEIKAPGAKDFIPLNNRMAFSYDKAVEKAVTGGRWYSSLEAPFQKFRWLHFPDDPELGVYTYRVTAMHMPKDNQLKGGDQVTLSITLDPIIYDGFLDIGFTRNFASSQAYADRYKNNPKIIPTTSQNGMAFAKVNIPGLYEWLGFEAYGMIFGLLTEIADDDDLTLDMLCYDLDEPDLVGLLKKIGKRLRIVIDDSGSHTHAGNGAQTAADELAKTAGKTNVKRMHFKALQHNKVLIVRNSKDASKNRVLFGSTNFSFRGLYIQANNALVVQGEKAADLFQQVFDLAFAHDAAQADATKTGTWFEGTAIEKQWHTVSTPGMPDLQFCFSPHKDSDISLSRIADAINTAVADSESAATSVFFSIAFLNQTTKGPVRAAIDALMKAKTFSYGISDKETGLEVYKPDHSRGEVSFSYLAQNAPPPFNEEWSGGSGIHQHDKFVVTNFNRPDATVFTGSCNMSPSGEEGNGDNLVMIQDQRVATSYAIEALRVFDHLHFRTKLEDALGDTKTTGKPKKTEAQATKALTLQKPIAISGEKTAWFERFYAPDTQDEMDRKLFSS